MKESRQMPRARIYFYVMGFMATALVTHSANAHVRLEREHAPANDFTVASLVVPHGCGESATTAITVKIAEGVTMVIPRAVPGWQVSVTKRTLEKPVMIRGFEVHETVDSITWSGGNLPSFAFERFDIFMKTPNKAGEALYFPTVQTCGTEEMHWANLPEAGQDNVAEPAPVLRLE